MDHIQKSPAFCLTNSPDFGEERKHFSHLFSHLMRFAESKITKISKILTFISFLVRNLIPKVK